MRVPSLGGLLVAGGIIARELLRGRPRRRDLGARLAMIPAGGAPVSQPVRIRWDAHQIPFVTASSEEDLAVGLGVVHAHLRLAQMEIMRRVALGRVAEMIGPLGVELDRALRTIGFAGAGAAVLAALPAETRRFAEHFLRGVNHHLEHAEEMPREFALLGLAREPWTLADYFAMARLAAADVTWLVFARLLRARRRFPDTAWRALWPRLLGTGEAIPAGPPLGPYLRAASNCAAVSGARSRSGAGMIASDPHLGLALPNLWLICGIRSPAGEAVGLMLAGFPFLALGRNLHIGWGGTNLHAASSDLFDVSGRAAEFAEREETLEVRGARPRRIRLRSGPLGAIVSDTRFFRAPRPLALAWVGTRASDELGAMLRLARARDVEEARRALESFAVPGQTMLVATADGAIAAIRAAHLPRRHAAPADLARDPDEAWPEEPFAVLARDAACAGAEGIVVSANDRAAPCPFPIGYFFSPPDRAARLRALLGGSARLTVADLQRAQQDMAHPAALALRDGLLAHADVATLAEPAGDALRTLAAWDGCYQANSAGALVFEGVVAELSRTLPGPRRLAPLAGLWTARGLIGGEILASPASLLAPALARALGRAARLRRRWRDWGGVHRLRLSHLAGNLPLIGYRYRFGSFPVGGGNDTPNKTGHGPVRGRHAVTFGASARHVSDLADPDENHFVLLGGQDGWLGSANFADQVPLWRAGETIRVPLTAAAVARQFPFETVLTPP